MNEINVFVSFDLDHDVDLFQRLLAQSAEGSLGFKVSGRSEAAALRDSDADELRRRIRAADQVIVICGEHTDASTGVFAELRIAQEEQKPYFLLWGRRTCMCTKPTGSKSSEGIYSWTFQILQDQLTLTTRNNQREKAARAMRRPERPA